MELGMRHVNHWNNKVRGKPWSFRNKEFNDRPFGCSVESNGWTWYVKWNSNSEEPTKDRNDIAKICKNPRYVKAATCEDFTCPSGTNKAHGAGDVSSYKGLQCSGSDPSTCDADLCCRPAWEKPDACPPKSAPCWKGGCTPGMKQSASTCPDKWYPFEYEYKGKAVTLCCGNNAADKPADDKKLTPSQRLGKCIGLHGQTQYNLCNPNINPCNPNNPTDQPGYVSAKSGVASCPGPK